MGSLHLSIIIPAFNEETRLPATLEAIEAWRRSHTLTSEVIVVDDHSSDGTVDLVRRFGAAHPGVRVLTQEQNLGKGAAVKAGMLAAMGDYRVFMDADNSTPIDEADRFFPYFEGSVDGHRYDMVIGSRRVSGAELARRQPPHREAAGRFYSLLVRTFLISGYLDTQCGFKMFTAKAAEALFSRQTIPGFGFDIEILYVAVNVLGYRVREAPIHWTDSPVSRVRLLNDSTRMFLDILQIRKTKYQA